MKYLSLFLVWILFFGIQLSLAVSLPNQSNSIIHNWGSHPVKKSKTQKTKHFKEKASKSQKKISLKNFFKMMSLKKALKPAPEMKLLDILLILLIVVLLLFVLMLLDGLTRGLLSALLIIALIVILVLWLMGKI